MSCRDEVPVVDEGGAAVELPAVGEGHEPRVLAGVCLRASYDAAAPVGRAADWGRECSVSLARIFGTIRIGFGMSSRRSLSQRRN